jgi:hypothetical protein
LNKGKWDEGAKGQFRWKTLNCHHQWSFTVCVIDDSQHMWRMPDHSP